MIEPQTLRIATGIHLPSVDDHDRDEVRRHIAAAVENLPEVGFVMSAKEAEGCRDALMRGSGPFTHGEVLSLIVPIVETLFDDTCRISPAFHAQLIMMCQFPSIPESMVVQIAFGRRVGEEQVRKIARMIARAQHRGLTVDEYVVDLQEHGAVPHDGLVKMFLGESKRTPSVDRIRLAVGLLRTTAALAAEPMRPPILCAISWLLWAQGKRALALNYLAEASTIDPYHPTTYGLSVHLGGHLPAWLSDRSARATR